MAKYKHVSSIKQVAAKSLTARLSKRTSRYLCFEQLKIFHGWPYTNFNNFDEKVFILIIFYLLMSRSTEIKLMIHWQIKMGCCSQHKRVTQTNNPVLGAMHIPKIPIILTIEHCISVKEDFIYLLLSSTVFIIFHFIHLRWSSQ